MRRRGSRASTMKPSRSAAFRGHGLRLGERAEQKRAVRRRPHPGCAIRCPRWRPARSAHRPAHGRRRGQDRARTCRLSDDAARSARRVGRDGQMSWRAQGESRAPREWRRCPWRAAGRRARFRAKRRDHCEQIARDLDGSIWSRQAERRRRGGIARERDVKHRSRRRAYGAQADVGGERIEMQRAAAIDDHRDFRGEREISLSDGTARDRAAKASASSQRSRIVREAGWRSPARRRKARCRATRRPRRRAAPREASARALACCRAR